MRAGGAESRAVISGVGQTPVGRPLSASVMRLTIDSIKAAVTDAGLTLDDIDGLVVVNAHGAAWGHAGFSGPDPEEVKAALGLRTEWESVSVHGVPSAVLAVGGGFCRHVVVVRTITEGRQAKAPGGKAGMGGGWQTAGGDYAWSLPVGAASAANLGAMWAQRYLWEYGVSREQVGWLAVVEREHAARNPNAIYKTPITLDEYMSARMISSPICLLDCDVPVDASTAIVVSSRDTVGGLRAPVAISAMAASSHGPSSWGQWPDMTSDASQMCAAAMWAKTDLKPSDVDVAQLYDGFSYFCLMWLESLGFCGPGEAGAFIEGGDRIRLGGELPLNTWGGQLSGGRVHVGMGHCVEAVRQLRGDAGSRQVGGAQVAVYSSGDMAFTDCALLTRI